MPSEILNLDMKEAGANTRRSSLMRVRLSFGSGTLRKLSQLVYLHGDVAIFTGDYTETGTREGVEYSDAGLFT
jgi:hypothetical protein